MLTFIGLVDRRYSDATTPFGEQRRIENASTARP